ncbi:MAG: PDZ domain-containing protein [Alphaproteobacteria bacterium]|nr:PDZ domain-containing protein [Alphaproteobacteria bacterium]MCB9697167.1 PDZ domain-containing protein [Alphaproteobacteria bacterium]
MSLLLSWLAIASAEQPERPEARAEPYDTAVELIEDLFLEPELIDPHRLLVASGRELEQRIPWLFIRETAQGMEVLHGGDDVVVTLPWPGMDTLPATLARLSASVEASGYELDGVEPRLAVLTGLAEGLDRFSRVLADERLDRFNARLSGTQVGIGASFQHRAEELVITGVTPGGPAHQSGLRSGDVLLRIDGRSTVGMPTSEVTRRVSGVAGTQVRLQVRRLDQELGIAVTRAEVVIPNVVSKVLDGGVGYLAIDHVSQRTVQNIQAALRELQAQQAVGRGLVLDLRGNTGGSMKESAWAADLFVHEGELLRTVGKDGGAVQNLQAEMTARDDGNEIEVPVVILVDERTASGAEILAGALLELDRAAIVGRRTYGKGTVQKIYDLDRDVRLKLTVARYLLANGRSISDGGIVPDVTAGRIIPLESGMWYRGFDPSNVGTAWPTALPEIVGTGLDDVPLELARRAVLGAHGPERRDVLAAVTAVSEKLGAEQDEAMAALLAERGLSWERAPEDAPTSAPKVRAELSAQRLTGGRHELRVSLTNEEPVPLFRAQIELACRSAGWWDGVVVPFGRIEPGQTVEGVALVDVPRGIEPRVDAATAQVRADRRALSALGEQLVPSASNPAPTMRLSLRVEPDPEGALGPHGHAVKHVAVTVQDLDREALTGVEVHLGYPDSDAVELLDWGVRVPRLAGRSEKRVLLDLEVGPGAPEKLPLSVRVEDDDHGELLDWPVALPLDGSTVVLQAPTLEIGPVPTRMAPGRLPISLTALDDRTVDDVVVTVNGRKIAWNDGGANRVELLPAIDVRTGENRVVTTVHDDQGLITRRTVVVFGDGPETVSAEP